MTRLLPLFAFVLASCGSPLLSPFADTEVGTFRNGSIEFSYAFDLPRGVAQPPVVVLGHGSGRVTADVLAEPARILVQQGFAVFRYDKRGTGDSGGTYSKAFADITLLAGDMVAAVEFVRSDPRVDTDRIGLLGSSQAGWVIPETAVRSPHVAFAVIRVGPAVTGQQANYWADIASQKSRSIADLEAEFELFKPSGTDLDVLPFLRQLGVPTLWLLGAEDRVIPSGPTREIVESLAREEGRPFEVVTYPGKGHSLDVNYWYDFMIWFDREVGD